jgi:hypothetical protein
MIMRRGSYILRMSIKEEREEDITTNSGVDSEDRIDPDSDSNFDDDISGDEDIENENM